MCPICAPTLTYQGWAVGCCVENVRAVQEVQRATEAEDTADEVADLLAPGLLRTHHDVRARRRSRVALTSRTGRRPLMPGHRRKMAKAPDISFANFRGPATPWGQPICPTWLVLPS